MKAPQVNRIEPLESRIAPAVLTASDANNNLLVFDSSTPGEIDTIPVTGLKTGERIAGIDFRPATCELYALGILDFEGADAGRIYRIDPQTGAATQIGGTFPFSDNLADGAQYGFDFDPQSDMIRVVNTADQNFRASPNGGRIIDTTLDNPEAGEEITAVAYDRNFDGTAATTAFGIDAANGVLVAFTGVGSDPSQSSPNNGLITTVGSLGLAGITGGVGFDIAHLSGTAYATFNVDGITGLYTIDLATGSATFVGEIGDGSRALTGFSVSLAPDLKIVKGKSATFTDEDGDRVTISVSKGQLSNDDFIFAAKEKGFQLRLLDISNEQEYAKGRITISAATPKGGPGDSLVNVGFINAAGVDLGGVVIDGDLGRVNAGDSTTASTGLGLLSVNSMGVEGTSSQIPLIQNLKTDIVGKLGKLYVKGNFDKVRIEVLGGSTAADGKIDSIVVGGDIIGGDFLGSGTLYSSGNIGTVVIGGFIKGGTTTATGGIASDGTVGKIIVGKSIIGGTRTDTGYISTGGKIGFVQVNEDIQAGTSMHSGLIRTHADIGSLVVKGSLKGGPAMNAGTVTASGKIGKVAINGDLDGDLGYLSGSISADRLGSVFIKGSLLGGDAGRSGSVVAANGIGSVKVGGNVEGGSKLYDGSILTDKQFASIGSVTISGSLTAKTALTTGIVSAGSLGPVLIKGNLSGSDGIARVIAFGAQLGSPDAKQPLAIKSLTVLGNVDNAQVVAGLSPAWLDFASTDSYRPNAQIGPVKIGGNWAKSSIAASINPGANGFFGDADDQALKGIEPYDKLFSKIASIQIKGTVTGSAEDGDQYAFVAQQIGSLKVGNTKIVLTPGAGNDLAGLPVGSNTDVLVREVWEL